MRFLFFNIVVGVALIYLYNGDRLDISRYVGAATAASEILASNTGKEKPTGSGHGRDVIKEPAKPVPTPPATPPETKALNRVVAGDEVAMVSEPGKLEALAPIEEPTTVAKRVLNKPLHGKSTPVIELDIDPAVAQRRREVLDIPIATAPEIALTDGSTLMSTSERRRALDQMAEEMEMLFLEQVGG